LAFEWNISNHNLNLVESGDKHHKHNPNPNQYDNSMAAQNILKVIFMEHAYM
jgi:hypothetical protein